MTPLLLLLLLLLLFTGDCGALVMSTLQSNLFLRADLVTAFLKLLGRSPREAAADEDAGVDTAQAAAGSGKRGGRGGRGGPGAATSFTCSRVDVWLLIIISGMVQFKKQVCQVFIIPCLCLAPCCHTCRFVLIRRWSCSARKSQVGR